MGGVSSRHSQEEFATRFSVRRILWAEQMAPGVPSILYGAPLVCREACMINPLADLVHAAGYRASPQPPGRPAGNRRPRRIHG